MPMYYIYTHINTYGYLVLLKVCHVNDCHKSMILSKLLCHRNVQLDSIWRPHEHAYILLQYFAADFG